MQSILKMEGWGCGMSRRLSRAARDVMGTNRRYGLCPDDGDEFIQRVGFAVRIEAQPLPGALETVDPDDMEPEGLGARGIPTIGGDKPDLSWIKIEPVDRQLVHGGRGLERARFVHAEHVLEPRGQPVVPG